ncbi:hypothetical protein ACFX13_036967 [Malus domestica]
MDPSHPISSFHQIPPHPRIRGFALSFVLSLRINIKRESSDAIDADDDMVSDKGQRSGSGLQRNDLATTSASTYMSSSASKSVRFFLKRQWIDSNDGWEKSNGG